MAFLVVAGGGCVQVTGPSGAVVEPTAHDENWQRVWSQSAMGYGDNKVRNGFAVGTDGRILGSSTNNPFEVMRIAADGSSSDTIDLSEVGLFMEPSFSDIERMPDGSFVGCDTINQRLVKFNAAGEIISTSDAIGNVWGATDFKGAGVGVHPGNGRVYVVDMITDSVFWFNSSLVAQGSFDPGTTAASDVAVDSNGKVFVNDTNDGSIYSFDSSHVALGQFYQDVVHFAWALEVAPDNSIWTLASNENVQHISAAGALLSAWGTDGTNDGQISTDFGGSAPLIDIEFDQNGKLLVSDTTMRLQRFETTGAWIQTLSPMAAIYSWSTTVGVTDDAIYTGQIDWNLGGNVVDNAMIQIHDFDGGIIGSFGSDGAGNGQFTYIDSEPQPFGAPDGSVWVIDDTTRIQHFTSDGTFISSIDTTAIGGGAFPNHLAVGADGSLWVTFPAATSVKHIGPDGSSLGAIGLGTLNNTLAVFVGTDGDIYVSDRKTDNEIVVRRYSSSGSLERVFEHVEGVSGPNTTSIGLPLEDGSVVFGLEPPGTPFNASSNDYSGLHRYAADETYLGAIARPTNTDGDGIMKPWFAQWHPSTDSLLMIEHSTEDPSFTLREARLSRWTLDMTAPVMTATGAALSSSSVRFTVAASDDNSGLHATAYSFNNGTTWQSSATFDATGLDPETTVSKTIVVRDANGNLSDAQTVSATSDAAQTQQEEEEENTDTGGGQTTTNTNTDTNATSTSNAQTIAPTYEPMSQWLHTSHRQPSRHLNLFLQAPAQ